jgi:hypothetical protein
VRGFASAAYSISQSRLSSSDQRLAHYVLMKLDRFATGASNLVHQGPAACIVQLGYHHLGAFTGKRRCANCADA